MTSPPPCPSPPPAALLALSPSLALALAKLSIASVERRHRGERGQGAGQVVRDGHAGPYRRPIRVAGQVQETAERDAQAVEAGPGRIGPGLPEHADPHVHQVVWQVGRSEAPSLHGAGPEVLAQDVGRRHQPLEEILPLRMPEVARDTPPAAAFDRPRQRVSRPVVHGDERPHAAHEVARAGKFDLDHVGSELAQQPCAERGGDPRADVDHPDARERPARRSLTCPRPGGPCPARP